MTLEIFRVGLYLIIIVLSGRMIWKLYPVWDWHKPDIVNALMFILIGNVSYFFLIGLARCNRWFVTVPQQTITDFLTISTLIVCGATVITYRMLTSYYCLPPPKTDENNQAEISQPDPC